MKKGIIKWTLRGITALAVVLILLLLLLRSNAVQNFITTKILDQLSDRYHAQWSIENIDIDYFDELTLTGVKFLDTANDTLVAASRLHIDIGLLSLFGKKVVIDDIEIDNLSSSIYQVDSSGTFNYSFLINPEKESPEKDPNPSNWYFQLKHISLNNPHIRYTTNAMDLDNQQQLIELEIDHLDLENKALHLQAIKLEEGVNIIRTFNTGPSAPSENVLPAIPYSILLNTLTLKDQDVVIDINNVEHQVEQLSTQLTDISYSENSLHANTRNLTARIKDWVDIDKLDGQIDIIGNTIVLEQLDIQSQEDKVSATQMTIDISNNLTVKSTELIASIHSQTISRFEQYFDDFLIAQKGSDLSIKAAQLEYSPEILRLDKVAINYGKSINLAGSTDIRMDGGKTIETIDAKINKLEVNLPVLDAAIVPLQIPNTYKNYKKVTLSGKAKGSLQKLNFYEFSVLLDDALDIDFSGDIANIENTDKLVYNIDINKLRTDVDKLPIEQPETIDLVSLGNIAFIGVVNGSTQNMRLDGNIVTDIGRSTANISFINIDDLDQLEYDGDIAFDDFQLGTFLQRTDVGNISLNTQVRGSGTNMEVLKANINGQIQSIAYGGYEYSDITVASDFKNNKLAGKIAVNDKNLKLDYDGIIEFDSISTVANFQASIDTIALAGLGIYDQNIGFKTDIKANIKLPLESGDKGQISLTNLSINNANTSYSEESVVADIGRQKDSTSIIITSGLMDASVIGDYKISTMLSGILATVDKYYSIDKFTPINDVATNNYKVNASLKHLRPIQILMPDKDIQLGLATASIDVDDRTHTILGNITIDSLIYDRNLIPEAIIDIGQEANTSFINFTATQSVLSNGMNLPLIKLNNRINDSQLTTTLIAENNNKEPQLSLRTLLNKSDDLINISIVDTVGIRNSQWAVSESNNIRIQNGDFTINNLTFSDRNTSITINSTDDRGNDFDIKLDQFDIGPILDFYLNTDHESEIKLNGLAQVKDLRSNPFYLVDLVANDVILDQRNIGNVTITADQNPRTKLISAALDLTGVKNNFNANGTFNPSDKRIDFDVDIPKLQLNVLDPFLAKIISQSKGYVSGKAKVSGTSDEPQINGDLTFEDVWTTIMVNNSRYNITQHTVTFDNESINLGNLELKDDNGDIARVQGKIYHKYLDNFSLDLNVDTEKFVFLNTTAQNNPIFYGKMVLDANATIKGPIDLLDVDVVASSLDSTSITISPFSETESILKEDFISFGKPEDYETNTEEYLLKLARLYPFKVDIQLQAKENALFTFVVDPVTGDKIQTKGTGNLQIKLDPDGQQEIYGVYEISSGDYSFSYGDFVTKKFKIEEGGKIKFNGNPLTATLDIKAVYEVYTSTYELIKNEVSLNDTELSTAQNRTNVEVYLALSGSLENPEITLDIKIPTAESGTNIASIDRKLGEIRNNPNELSNQVFGLLLFNSFIISNSSNSTIDDIGSSIALSSISSLISGQLNNLANNYVKGVDVSVDVNSYNSEYLNEGTGGNVTEIGLQVSKQLFNDRVKITAGGNLNLEESTGTSQYTSFVGDFVLEYKLTESGKYRVRVFSKSNYDRLLNENNNKNGVSLYFNKSFDRKINESK